MLMNEMNDMNDMPIPKKVKRRTRSKASKWWQAMGFARKKDIEQAIREITNNAPLSQPLTPAQEEFLISVLEHHADWEEKRGVGIQHLEMRVNVNGTGSTRGIWIKRIDGTEIDISWVVALKEGGETTPLEDLRTAAREAIQEQMHAVHESGSCEQCELCGEAMIRYDSLHVDHVISFDEIFKDFFGGRESDIEVSNAGTTTAIVDPQILKSWQQHHLEKAKLRLVHKHCNLKRKRS